MTETARLAEVAGTGTVPWASVPGWETFGVVAGVTERGPGEPFDLGLAGSRPIKEVLDRWRALAAAFDRFDGIVIARQVHGTSVLWHDRAAGLTILEGADGHATATPGILLAVSLADCVPIYLVDPVRRAVALLHSGWRGTAAGILANGVAALTERGSRPADLRVHAGVGICGDCYQVGAEVATACGRPPSGPGPVQLDLRQVIAGQAAGLGVGGVSVSTLCSAHTAGRFMSHRASGGRDGRMVALLGLLPP